MKKINFKILIITCIMCLLPISLGLVFYNELPETLAIHFDVNNNPDGFMGKNYFIFGAPIIMMLIQIFACVVTDINDENPEANKRTIIVYKCIIPIITLIMYVVTIIYAMNNTLDIRKIVMIILGAMFIVMGNYLPKTVGDRMVNFPKIQDEKVYAKAKRVFGYLFIIDGILFIVSSLFGVAVSIVVFAIFVLQAFGLMVYAVAKNNKKN